MPPNNNNQWRGYEKYHVFRGTTTDNIVLVLDFTEQANFNGYHSAGVQIENLGDVDLYVTLDGETDPVASDTPGKTLLVPAGEIRAFHVACTEVRLLSASACRYQVLGLN